MIKKINNKGFSLIEMMVSMAVFSILVVTATTSYVKAVDRQKDVRYMGLISEEVNTIFNRISKNIRSAESVYNVADNSSEEIGEVELDDDDSSYSGDRKQSVLIIETTDPDSPANIVEKYRLNEGAVEYWSSESTVPSWEKLTINKFKIEQLKFNVRSELAGENSRNVPYVVIAYTGYFKDNRGKKVGSTRVDISSTVSMRSVIRNK